MIDNINNPIIGVDLGTTFSSISRWNGKRGEVYAPKGEEVIPSVVYYDSKRQKFTIGKVAASKGLIYPENVCIGVKRHIDNKYEKIRLGDRNFTPIELSAKIIEHVYANVRDMFPENKFRPTGVVITVPYYFRANQCSNTEEAAKMAGLNLLGIIQEPIAAAFEYGLHLAESCSNIDRNILVFDLGGGTFDLTLFNLKVTDDSIEYKVIATDGDDRLGGLDFDNALYEYIIERENIKLEDLDYRAEMISRNKLMEQVTRAKKQLSFDEIVPIVVDVPPGQFLDCEVTRAELESCISRYTEKIKAIMKNILYISGISPNEIDEVIKIGGTSNVAIVNDIIDEVVGVNKIYANINPELAVAEGAAVYGAYLAGEINIGKKIEVSMITSYALGVCDANNEFIELIPKNVKVPYERTLVFTTDTDNAVQIDVEVFQASESAGKERNKIGVINVDRLFRAPKGTLDIPITFRVNRDQTVEVRVVQVESGIDVVKRF